MKSFVNYMVYVLVLLILYGIMILISVGIANAQIVVAEDFNYPTGSLGGQWSVLCSGHLANVKSPGLVYPGYIGSGIGNAGFFDTSGSEYKLTNNINITSFAYMSFMINSDGIQTGGGGTCSQGNDFVAAFQVSGGGSQNFNNHTGLILKSINSSQYTFGIQGPTAAQVLANGVYNVKTTYLVVLALDQTNYYLYINPPLDGSLATPDVTYPHDMTYSSIDNVVLGQNNYGHIFIDGIRITSNLADVTINALAPEPVYPPANLTFANVTSNSLIVFYSAGQDNPNSSLAVRNAGANVSFSPSDGDGYTIGQDVGNGDTISLASGCCAINESGLRPETNYFYRIFSANQTGDNSTINYLTTTYLEGSQYTLSLEPAAHPSTFTASAPSSSQINLSFSAASTIVNADGYVILLREDGTDPTATGFVNGANVPDFSFPSGTTFIAVINANGVTTFAHAGLSPNTKYNYAIIPFNWDGVNMETRNYHTSGTIKTASTYTLTLPPNALPATSLSQTGFTANWNSVVGAANYSIDVSTDYFVTFVSGYHDLIVPDTAGTIDGLSAGSNYQYRVRAINAAGASAYSNAVGMVTVPATPQVAAPTSIDQTSFVANWGAAAGASSYFLDISADNFATYVSGYQNLPLVANVQLVTNVAAGVTYQYRVRAANASGISPSSASTSVLTLPATPLAAAPTAVAISNFDANWNSVNGCSNYSLEVSADNFATLLPGYDPKVFSSPANSDTIKGLSAGRLYKYRIKALNASGESPYSNVVSVPTIPVSPTDLSVSQTLSTGFVINWSLVTGVVDHYEVDVSKDDFVTFETGYHNAVVNASSNFEGVSNLLPATLYQFRVRAANSSGVSANATSAAFTLTNTGETFSLLLANPTFNTAPSSTSIGTLTTNVSNAGAAVVSVLFHHKKISNNAFQSDTVFQTNGTYQVTVSDKMLDELGMEYYFYAGDDLGRKDSTTRTKIYQAFDGPSSPEFIKGKFSGSFNDYRIVAIPYDLKDNLIQTIFEKELGAYDIRKWRFGHYQDGQVLEYGNGINRVDRGSGYWFNAKNADSLLIRTGAGNAPNNDTRDPFLLSLSKGWNQIGNPYPFTISWNDVLAHNASVTGIGPLKTFVNGSFTNGDAMAPFTGGFVFADHAATVSIPVTLRKVENGRISHPNTASDLNQQAWQITLGLVQGDRVNNLGGIGMHPQASDGKDDFDDLTLPRFGEYLELVHPHPEYFFTTFSRDIMPTAATHIWKFSVACSNPEEEVKLTWDKSALGTGEAQLLLLDVQSGHVVNMKEHDSYSIRGQGRNDFQVFFSSARTDFAMFDGDLLGLAYPNPFNGSTTIPFVLADNKSSYSSELAVYDMAGRKSKTLMAGQITPGYYQLTWDGTDDSGNNVSPGVYVYRLLVDGKSLSRRVVLK